MLDGTKLSGNFTNQFCIGVVYSDGKILRIFERSGRQSKRKTLESFKDGIAPRSTLVHDKDNTHSILIELLGLSSESYDADEFIYYPTRTIRYAEEMRLMHA